MKPGETTRPGQSMTSAPPASPQSHAAQRIVPVASMSSTPSTLVTLGSSNVAIKRTPCDESPLTTQVALVVCRRQFMIGGRLLPWPRGAESPTPFAAPALLLPASALAPASASAAPRAPALVPGSLAPPAPGAAGAGSAGTLARQPKNASST